MFAQFIPDGAPVTPIQHLSPDGVLAAGVTPSMSDDQLLAGLRLMMLTRVFDTKAMSLQRQGRFGTFSQVTGQEASIVGSASALDPLIDWVVPQYRELPALLRQGLPLSRFMLYFMGNLAGSRIPDGVNILPIQISLAAQIPQAVGLAWGLQMQQTGGVVVVYFGDGASSEGDFHEACNLAGVVKAPVVFMLSNNGWAISTPRHKQSAASSLASRAIGYGFPGVVVDGNDLLAVHAVTAEAVARARSGHGPTLIESVTYRMGPHNTADDPTRYVDAAALESWKPLDPIVRVQRHLASRRLWDDDRRQTVEAELSAEVDAALVIARAEPAPTASQLFDHVYADPPSTLQRQRAARIGATS
ncbi:MAG: Pyruvate dehydrogenase (acetyl-transferring) [Ilumatobacteraceae bacterium]|nr:Pyruvate dehydrogenase (acetyl-transferring) [Ilumatobacteraceae bacterium]